MRKPKGPGALILRKIKVYHYALDPHTRKVSWMAERIGVSHQRVSQILDELVEAGYLEEYQPRQVPRQFTKGVNSLLLDMSEMRRQQGIPTLDSTKSLPPSDGCTELTNHTEAEYPEIAPRYLLFHHCSFMFKVGKEGDTSVLSIKHNDGKKELVPFLNNGTLLNSGEWRHDGKISVNGRVTSLTYYHTDTKDNIPKNCRMQVYCPELYIPIYPNDDEDAVLAAVREKAESLCQDAVNYVAKHGHWSFGLIEDTNWKPHWAAVDDRILGNVANQGTFYSKTGAVRTSNSAGRSEFETEGWNASAVKVGMKSVELPEAVLALEGKVGAIAPKLDSVASALGITSSEVKEIREYVTSNGLDAKAIHARLDIIDSILVRMVDQSEGIARVNVAHHESIAALSGRSQQPEEGIYAKSPKSKWDIGYC